MALGTSGRVSRPQIAPVPCVTHRATARTTTDRSSRATHASPDRQGTCPPANPRSGSATNATRACLPPSPAIANRPPASTPSAVASDARPPCPPGTPDSGAVHHSQRPHARSSMTRVPAAARSPATTHPPPTRARSPPAEPTTTATPTAPAPAPPDDANARDDPTPCDGAGRSAHRSTGSATPTPTTERSLLSHAPITVPHHTSRSIKPDRKT